MWRRSTYVVDNIWDCDKKKRKLNDIGWDTLKRWDIVSHN
jgi:hypothetical protein